MAINTNYLAVFDFETSGLVESYPLEIACKVYNARSLEPIQDGEFHSMCKPPPDVKIEQGALDVTGIKREDVDKAPLLEVVWPQFVDWVGKYNSKKNKWEAPVPCGSNIRGFDLPICSRMNLRFSKKKEDTVLFNTFKCIDLLDIIFLWFENTNDLPNHKLDTIRQYFGITKDGSHRAMKDVEDTGNIIMRFLKLHRNLMGSGKVKFKDAFKV